MKLSNYGSVCQRGADEGVSQEEGEEEEEEEEEENQVKVIKQKFIRSWFKRSKARK